MQDQFAAASLLRSHAFFAGLDEPALRALVVRLRRHELAAGQSQFHRGDPGDAMFLVVSGAVRLGRDGAQGREFTVRLAGPGEVFGEIAVIDGAGRTTDCVAIMPSVLLALSRRDFQAAFRASPAMQDAVLASLCARLRATTDQLESIALLPLEGRLAKLMLLFANANDEDVGKTSFELKLGQQQLAALVGATRPPVNRILVDWQSQGIMQRAGKRCTCDLDALRAIVARDDGL